MVTVGINGFGRIGRMCLRACLEKKEIEVNHINDPFLNTDYMVYLFKYDSTHGTYPKMVECDEGCLVIDEKKIQTSQEKDPSKIKWKESGVTFVIEATGVFTSLEKASLHIDGGAKRVIITAPSVDAPMFVFGVNHRCYDPKKNAVVSTTSCTTNCAAPIIKIIHDNFDVIEAMVTAIHAVTTNQRVLDGPIEKRWRDGRGCLQNIIPTSTGAAKAIGKVIPELKDKVTAIAFRVPVPNVSLCDITLRLNKPTTYDDIKRVIKVASTVNVEDNGYKGIVEYVEEDCVSSDFNHTTFSCVFDAKSGIPQTSSFIKVVGWYDNEYGYSNRVIDMILYMSDVDTGKITASNLQSISNEAI